MILRTGSFLQDRYEIIKQIGSGGMSEVYKAKCHILNRMVAIKVLKDEFCHDENFITKFKSEAQAAARLSHPNIVSVYDVVDDGKLHYIVMELIEGMSLKDYILQKGHLGAKETTELSLQIAQGIGAAHLQHIVHRDIKPQNIIFTSEKTVKITDFGIARAASKHTLTSMAVGSVHYISPEQATGKPTDERTDIYSLGITMYEMITGELPFDGETPINVALAHIENTIVAPGKINASIPISLEQIILKCCQRAPENRYQSMGEVINDLKRSLSFPNVSLIDPNDGMDVNSTRAIDRSQVRMLQNARQHAAKKENSRIISEMPKRNIDYNDYDDEKIPTSSDKRFDKIILGFSIGVAIVVAIALFFIVRWVTVATTVEETEATIITTTESVTETQTEEITTEATIIAPQLVGKTLDEASSILSESGLSSYYKIGEEYSDEYDKDIIMLQDPEAGSEISPYTIIKITVSKGVLVDIGSADIIGKTVDEVRLYLEDKGLVVETADGYLETAEVGKIISYSPEELIKGDTITLTINTGIPIESTDDTGETIIIVPSLETGDGYKYIGAINQNYNLTDLIGPGAASTTVTVLVRLHQVVNGQDVYTTLMAGREISGNTILPIRFSSIEGAYGVDTGIVEVVNVTTNEVLKSYDVDFFRVQG